MKSRPILFSSLMVRAILDGSKTQTRRIAKDIGDENCTELPNGDMVDTVDLCPFGKPGETLWCRETHSVIAGKCYYRATLPEGNLDCHFKPWKPSIFMRREHSRITLEITNVRVERLQDISSSDAVAEGVASESGLLGSDLFGLHNWADHLRIPYGDSYARARYAMLWQSINGPGSFDRNPFVWVVEFRRVRP